MLDLKQKISELAQFAMADRNSFETPEEAQEFLCERLESIPKYVNSIVEMEIRQPVLMARYEGEEFQDKYKQLDEKRRYAHEKMIRSCNQLNRYCDMNDLERICPVDTEDRYAVADFAGQFVGELYYDSDFHTIDKAVEARNNDYYDAEEIDDLVR